MVFAVGAPDDTSRFRSPRLDRGTASTLADHRPLACALQILASRLKGGFMANIGSVRQVGHADLGLQSIAAPAPQLALVAGGMICLATALLLLGARLYAFEAVVAAAAALLSADGVVDAGNRRALSLALLAAAGLAAFVGALLLAMSYTPWRAALAALLVWDPLRELGLAVPAAPLVLAASTATGALFISLHLVGSRLGAPIGPLFQKEGFFEMVTAALALASAAWSAAAALRWKRHEPQLPRGAPVLYAALALTLFLFAMEELNWGQTLLGFDTPAAWAEINYQQQTSLHNVIDAPLLELVERVLIVAFGFVVLGLIALALKLPRSTFATIAPPASLVVLATLCWIPGAYLRLEVTELLFALFFAFYCYRIDVAARSLKPAAG
jgi:hypothetical protein